MDKFKVRKNNQFRAACFLNEWSAFDGNLEIYPTPDRKIFLILIFLSGWEFSQKADATK